MKSADGYSTFHRIATNSLVFVPHGDEHYRDVYIGLVLVDDEMLTWFVTGLHALPSLYLPFALHTSRPFSARLLAVWFWDCENRSTSQYGGICISLCFHAFVEYLLVKHCGLCICSVHSCCFISSCTLYAFVVRFCGMYCVVPVVLARVGEEKRGF